jgi:hypothetical protein
MVSVFHIGVNSRPNSQVRLQPSYRRLTRAKKLAIVIGARKAVAIALRALPEAIALRQVKDQQRYTLLAHRLMSISIID